MSFYAPTILRMREAISTFATLSRERGYSPSLRELGLAMKPPVYSPGHVFKIVGSAIDRGHLTKAPGAARGLEITEKGMALIGGNDLSGLSNTALKQLARDVQAEIRRRTPRAVA